MKKTNRGFSKLEFTDSYGEKCSLQQSSSAIQHRIWLGVDEPRLTIFEDENLGKYIQTKLPKTFMVHSRMHLSRNQVAELLPHLQKFVETGEI